jgi:uncharacterized protein (UPF0147 family)
MIDEEKLAEIRTTIAGKASLKDPLKEFSEAELRKLLSEITQLLPNDTVTDLDLETELVSQYRKTKTLMDEILEDEDCPANQKAQVANSVISTLSQLMKMQEDLKREQTLKIMEDVLVDSLKTLPEEARTEFYAEYERLATQAGLM